MSERSINERIIKIIGSACIENDLEFGQDLSINVHGSILEISEKDNQDGTYNRIYKCKIITAECS